MLMSLVMTEFSYFFDVTEIKSVLIHEYQYKSTRVLHESTRVRHEPNTNQHESKNELDEPTWVNTSTILA